MMLPWPWHPPAGSSPGPNRAWSRWEVAVLYLWWREQTAWRRGWGLCHSVSHWPSGSRMERKQSEMGGAEAGCGLCFIAAVVQPPGWSMVGRCRVRSLTPLLPRAAVPVLHCGSLQHWESSPGARTSCRLNFTMIISNPKDRKGLEVYPGFPSAF